MENTAKWGNVQYLPFKQILDNLEIEVEFDKAVFNTAEDMEEDELLKAIKAANSLDEVFTYIVAYHVHNARF